MLDFPFPASAIAEATAGARPFSGRVVHRQVLEAVASRLWAPTLRSGRWNQGFAALYTALDLDVALAERIKRTLMRPASLAVASADATIGRTVDLTEPAPLGRFGLSPSEITAPSYSLPQRLGAALFEKGITALLVPAALATTARIFPRFEFVREGRREIRITPATGTNLVLFTDNLGRGDRYPEIARFSCEVRGLTASPTTPLLAP
jgi:RES domain-containing protein